MFQTLSPSDEYQSTGVGLTLLNKIVTMYGGKVWVESEVARGSTFFFTFPQNMPETGETGRAGREMRGENTDEKTAENNGS